MPTSFLTLPVGATQNPNGSQLGHQISQRIETVSFPGILPNQNGWNALSSIHVNNDNSWKKVESTYVNSNGEWKEITPKVNGFYPKKIVRLNLAEWYAYAADFGGISFMQLQTAGDYFIPAGMKITNIKWAGRYEDIKDGLFFAQSTALSQSLGQAKRKALIIAKRPSPTYTGLPGNTTNSPPNISAPGPQPSAFQWFTPSWYTPITQSRGGGNMQGVRIITDNLNFDGMCGGHDGPTYSYTLTIPNDYVLPFPVDQLISVRAAGNCGSTVCNHNTCGGSFLTFEEA
jgi:hypothetical protein